MNLLRILPLLLLVFLNGCSSYKLGSMLPPHIQTVFMPTVINSTSEPLLQNEVTTAIFSELQRDGSLSIESEDRADAILTVRVTRYHLTPLSYSDSNRSRPDEYRLELGAEVELVERETGNTLVRSGQVTGQDEFVLAGDLNQARRIGLPGAADDLAEKIVSTVTEAWVE